MRLRKRFNGLAKDLGNRISDGFGDLLTKQISLEKYLGIAGMIALPYTWAHMMCRDMYEKGVVDRMYSDNILERLQGGVENIGYTVSWLMTLPATMGFGCYLFSRLGNKLDKI